LDAAVKEALANVFWMLHLFNDKAPPSDGEVQNVIQTASQVAEDALAQLQPPAEYVDDL
jgi:hypothetical protein